MTILLTVLLTLFAHTPTDEPWVTTVAGPQYFAASVADVDSAAADAKPVGSLSAKAQRFRQLVEEGHFDVARAMMAPDPRRWWERREGEGQPWRIGAEANDPWAGWDDEFRSQRHIVIWSEDEESATALVRETNDYFRLLERGWVTDVITYYFDPDGLIDGLSIDATGDRPQGRTEEFLAWAKMHDPAELESLMPDGDIDPSGDHPQRFRNLLNRWRRSAGLEPIE